MVGIVKGEMNCPCSGYLVGSMVTKKGDNFHWISEMSVLF